MEAAPKKDSKAVSQSRPTNPNKNQRQGKFKFAQRIPCH